MADPLTKQFRVSFVWLRAFPDLINGSAPNAPMAFLGNQNDFAAHWDAAQDDLAAYVKKWNADNSALIEQAKADPSIRGKLLSARAAAYRAYTSDPLHLTPPWDWMQENYLHKFWDYYLNRDEEPLAAVRGADAWKALVPLRIVLPYKIRAPWLNGGIIVDGLLYPHAVGLAFMVNLTEKKDGLRYPQLMEQLFKLRENENFDVTLPDGTTSALKLDRLANRIMKDLLTRVFADAAPQTIALQDPLSVATFIHTLNVNPQLPIEDNSFPHRVLHGMSTWDPLWDDAKRAALPPIAALNLAYSDKGSTKIIYHSPRGRVVWFPHWFIKPPGRGNHKLSCYHRNLTLLVAQTEALALGAALAYPDVAAGKTPPDALKTFALNAAERARALYLRDIKEFPTYHSASPKAQLDENFLDEVKLMDIVMKVRETLRGGAAQP